MRMLYKYPQARVPVPRARRGERATDAPGSRVRAPRHGRLRREPLLGRLRDVREGLARGPSRRRSRPSTADPRRRRSTSSRRSGSATRGRGASTRACPASRRPSRRRAPPRSRSTTRTTATGRSTSRARRTSSSRTTSRTRAALRRRERGPVREGRVPRARRPRRRGRREPRGLRHEGGRLVPLRRAGRRIAHGAAAPHGPGARGAVRRRVRPRSSRRAGARRTPSTRT